MGSYVFIKPGTTEKDVKETKKMNSNGTVVETISMAGGDGMYNPFHYIENDMDVMELADTMAAGQDNAWRGGMKLLFTAIIAYLFHYCAENLRNMLHVSSLLRLMDLDEEDLGLRSDLDRLFDQVRRADPESFAVKQYASFCLFTMADRERIAGMCAAAVQAFEIPVDHVVSNDAVLKEIWKKDIVLYVNTYPFDEMAPRMFCMQLVKSAAETDGHNPVRIICAPECSRISTFLESEMEKRFVNGVTVSVENSYSWQKLMEADGS